MMSTGAPSPTKTSHSSTEKMKVEGDVEDAEVKGHRKSDLQVHTEHIEPIVKVHKVYIFRTPGKAHLFWSVVLTVFTLAVSIGLGFLWKLPEVDAMVPLQVSSDTPKVRGPDMIKILVS